jgi:CobQ-like glutamine amidotransferase family enzyme
MTLRIVHLYPSELGIFGDVGNVTALEMRARWSGIDVTIENVGVSDSVPEKADIYMIGSGSTAGVSAVAEVMPSLSRALTRARSAGATLIAIGAGMHLLGSRIEIRRGEHAAGAGLFDASSELRAERLVGPVAGRVGGHEVAGYVNSGHALEGSVVPLVENIHGLPIATDGVSLDGILGTNLHGPFLPMNSRIADDIIEKHTGVAVDLDEPRVRRATEAARRSRESLRRELGL